MLLTLTLAGNCGLSFVASPFPSFSLLAALFPLLYSLSSYSMTPFSPLSLFLSFPVYFPPSQFPLHHTTGQCSTLISFYSLQNVYFSSILLFLSLFCFNRPGPYCYTPTTSVKILDFDARNHTPHGVYICKTTDCGTAAGTNSRVNSIRLGKEKITENTVFTREKKWSARQKKRDRLS